MESVAWTTNFVYKPVVPSDGWFARNEQDFCEWLLKEGGLEVIRDYTCMACHQPFSVMNEIPIPETPEEQIELRCPSCNARTAITWPSGARAVVVAKYPAPK